MFDPKALLDQVLGGSAAGGLRNAGQSAKGRLDQYSGSGGFMRGAAAGGLLGLLLGGKGLGKVAGGVVSYGGAAALGALALKAYQDYQQKKAPGTASFTPDSLVALSDPRRGRALESGEPFGEESSPRRTEKLRRAIGADLAGWTPARRDRKVPSWHRRSRR